jgi:hypothetical protein
MKYRDLDGWRPSPASPPKRLGQVRGTCSATLQSVAFHSSVAAFLAGSDTPNAYLARCLGTIERLEPGIGAFVTLNIPGAVEAAAQSTRRWREGRPLSSIDGMQMGSDLYAGWRSERGDRVLTTHGDDFRGMPDRDSPHPAGVTGSPA